MTTSAVSICNGAAILLGADPITALTDDVKVARVLSANYDDVRRSELRARRWRFAIKRDSLAALSTTPPDYARQFQLPNDYLRLIEGGDIWEVADVSDIRTGIGSPLYSIEGRVILTNLGAPLKIRYLYDATDASLFDPCFVAMFSSALAMASCEAITQSDTKLMAAERRYKKDLRDAISANAFEVASQLTSDDSWIAARSL